MHNKDSRGRPLDKGRKRGARDVKRRERGTARSRERGPDNTPRERGANTTARSRERGTGRGLGAGGLPRGAAGKRIRKWWTSWKVAAARRKVMRAEGIWTGKGYSASANKMC